MANGAPSSEHSKRLSPEPVSVPEKVNEILVDSVLEPSVKVVLLPSVAESINVSGGTVSTVHVKEAGDESLLPELSIDVASSI